MSLWYRLFGRAKNTEIGQLASDASGAGRKGEVLITGVVEAEESFACPLTQEACVAVAYRAEVPGFVQRAYGLHAGGAMNLVANSSQAVNFFVRDPTGRAWVHVPQGVDLDALHMEMMQRYGFELRATTLRLRAGDRVSVRGEVLERAGGSPMRAPDYAAVIRATNYERLEP